MNLEQISPEMTVFLLTECITFDVYLTLASWSRQPLKNIRLSQQNYMEIGILILKEIENMNITSKECYHQLAPNLKICRIVNGMWQVAGGHGYIDHELAIEDMMRYHETGFTSWDLADIYGPAEDFIGKFRLKLSTLKGKEELNKIQALTKWAPQPVL
jgi:hypothetical protein